MKLSEAFLEQAKAVLFVAEGLCSHGKSASTFLMLIQMVYEKLVKATLASRSAFQKKKSENGVASKEEWPRKTHLGVARFLNSEQLMKRNYLFEGDVYASRVIAFCAKWKMRILRWHEICGNNLNILGLIREKTLTRDYGDVKCPEKNFGLATNINIPKYLG